MSVFLIRAATLYLDFCGAKLLLEETETAADLAISSVRHAFLNCICYLSGKTFRFPSQMLVEAGQSARPTKTTQFRGGSLNSIFLLPSDDKDVMESVLEHSEEYFRVDGSFLFVFSRSQKNKILKYKVRCF